VKKHYYIRRYGEQVAKLG